MVRHRIVYNTALVFLIGFEVGAFQSCICQRQKSPFLISECRFRFAHRKHRSREATVSVPTTRRQHFIRLQGQLESEESTKITFLRRVVTSPIRGVQKILGKIYPRRKEYPPPPSEELTRGTGPEGSKDTVNIEVFEAGDRTVLHAVSPGDDPDPDKAIEVSGTGRSAVSSVDLSGQWDLSVTEEFKQEYDKYLTLLGQPYLVRSVAVSIVGLTTEETVQTDDGKNLLIRGRNVRGVWERTLVASSSGSPIVEKLMTADDEEVDAEAWWENGGTVHHSWLRGVLKYGGGDFESIRYLEDDGRSLVCESTFHPNDESREKAKVTWRFAKQDKDK